MATPDTDLTAEFYKRKSALGFDDWCTSQGIGNQCLLHEAHGQTSLSYIFQRGDLTGGITHNVAVKDGNVPVPHRVVKMLCTNRSIIQNMLKVQHNFKYCDMDYLLLMIETDNKVEWLRMLGVHESRFRENPKGLLKLYLSHDYVLPEGNKPQSYRQAFLFADVCDVRASLSLVFFSKYGQTSACTFDLVTSDKQMRFVHYKYSPKEMLALIKIPLMLDDELLYQSTIDTHFVQEIRQAFQLEQAARMFKDAPPMDNVDAQLFTADDAPSVGL